MTSHIHYNNYTILLLYMSLLYANWYTPTIYMFEGVFQYTSLFTVYDSPLIRTYAYSNLRLYEPPLIRTSAYTSLCCTQYSRPYHYGSVICKKKFAIAKAANLD